MKNFKSSVPETVQLKLKEVADYIEQNMRDMVVGTRGFGLICEPTLNEIEGNYRSGWMPKQDGGFSVDVWTQNDIDSSYHFTEKQTEFNTKSQKHCLDSFLSDNGLDADTDYNDLTEDQKEELSNYENEWFESALLQFQMFVEGYTEWKNEDKQVTFRVSINYKDAPYYREKYAEDIKAFALEIDEFLQMPLEEIIEQLKV